MNTTTTTVTPSTPHSTDALQDIHQWGYVYDRPCPVAGVGYRRLVVAIRNQPTHRHYDPEQIDVPDREGDGRHQRISLHGAGVRAFGLGKIRLYDRFEKRKDFWAFGGTVTTMPLKDGTAYIFESDAPFLPIDQLHPDLNYHLAVELKALFGRVKADVHRQGLSFNQWSKSREPRAFYLASLASIDTALGQLPKLEPKRLHLRRTVQKALAEAGKIQPVLSLDEQIGVASAPVTPAVGQISPVRAAAQPVAAKGQAPSRLTTNFLPV